MKISFSSKWIFCQRMQVHFQILKACLEISERVTSIFLQNFHSKICDVFAYLLILNLKSVPFPFAILMKVPFFSRIFALIENSAQEHVHGDQDKLNPEQMMVEKAMASTFTSVLQQSSTPIFKVNISSYCWFHDNQSLCLGYSDTHIKLKLWLYKSSYSKCS